jgi:type III protein arginine methyltransferase
MSTSSPDLMRTATELHRIGRFDEAATIYRMVPDSSPRAAEARFLLGSLLCQSGNWVEGEAALRAAVSLRPGYALALNNLGQALRSLGRLDEALEATAAASVADPLMGEAAYNHAALLQEAGRTADAVDVYEQALRLLPHAPQVHNNLGACLVALGRLDAARAAFVLALQYKHDYAEACNNLGHVHLLLGDTEKALQAFDYALLVRPDYHEALVNKGTALAKGDKVDEAVRCLRAALALRPDDKLARARLRQVLGKVVPAWHFPMMNDAYRNQAYERAIRRAVGPGTRVLDIGTGAGLLAMMAARAGAEHVTTCEMVSVVAEKAAEVIALNGYADRVTVVARKSNDLQVGPDGDMPEPADVLVSEILSSDLLGESVLLALEDARGRLVKPDAIILPEAGDVLAFLAGGDDLELRAFATEVAGFNVSPFNEFSPQRFSIRRVNYPYARYSEDFTVFAFDFANTRYFPAETRRLSIRVTETGRCQGVVQWIGLHLLGERFENHPDLPNAASGWSHMFHAFPEAIDVKRGQTIHLLAEHDRVNVHIHLDRVE